MNLFTGWLVSAGLVLATAAANAQVPYGVAGWPYAAASDLGGPYSAIPRDVPVRRYAPSLLPPEEVYTVLRDSGFSPLGIPQQHGLVYTISVIDRGGDHGRLVIDARDGRIIRFMPAYRMGDNPNEDFTYGLAAPPTSTVRGAPLPPGSIPHVASRMMPVPKARPAAANPAPQPAQQSAALQPKPADAPPIPPPASAPTVGQARPAAPSIQPTREMPEVQGLE
jgi:hypothetical protein